MKKLIAVFMVLAMAISLAACTSDSAAQKEDKENSDTKFTPAEREPDEDSVLGAVDSESVVWENEMLGLGFEAPEGWSFATDSELAEMAGVSSDLLKEYSDITEIAETFFDMAASDNDSKDNVNVTIDKLTSAQANGADLYGHLDSQIDLLRDTYKNMGYENLDFEHITVEIGSREFEGLGIKAEISGIKMEQIVFLEIVDNYLWSMSITAFNESSAEDYISNFYAF